MSDPIRDLREMDQLVYQMQTAGTPDQLRSAVQRAWVITEKRMKAESNRIGALMETEIRKTYTEPTVIQHDADRTPKFPIMQRPTKLIGKS